MRTKLWILGAALSLLAALPARAIKVYQVTSGGLADVKVYVTDNKGQADCVIHVETSEGLAKGNARWYYATSAGLADVNVYFTDSEGLADKKVYFTTSEGLARCDVEWKNYKKQRSGLTRPTVGSPNLTRPAGSEWTFQLPDIRRFRTSRKRSHCERRSPPELAITLPSCANSMNACDWSKLGQKSENH